jgi:hypothetical protein
VQVPLQTVPPLGQPQTPPLQFWPPVQAWPHWPQLALSMLRFLQTPGGQSVKPVGQPPPPPPQAPFEQVAPLEQTLPQLPQLFGSVRVLVQPVPVQKVWPFAHLQTWLVQVVPAGQTLPHLPQLFGSLFETQTLLQSRWPVGHLQTPLPQAEPVGQTRPQAPQLFESLLVFVQVDPQQTVPGAQVPQAAAASSALGTTAASTAAARLPPIFFSASRRDWLRATDRARSSNQRSISPPYGCGPPVRTHTRNFGFAEFSPDRDARRPPSSSPRSIERVSSADSPGAQAKPATPKNGSIGFALALCPTDRGPASGQHATSSLLSHL